MEIIPISAIFLFLVHFKVCLSAGSDEDSKNSAAAAEDKQFGYLPHGPLVKCSFL